MSKEINDKLFPVPTHLPYTALERTPLIPRTWPGVSATTTQTLQEILNDNHTRWHIFFDDRGFHNHSAHTVLTLWCLGADSSILEASYKDSSAFQRPQFASPTTINQKTWQDHLGNAQYYQAYLQFFTEQANKKNFTELLEEYIFASSANFGSGAHKEPEMLNRFLGGLLHPMIHTGLGVEFGLPGLVVEGLAQTAVHPAPTATRFPSLWDHDGLATRLASTVGLVKKTDVHAFTILARILKDPRFISKSPPSMYEFYGELMQKHGHAILEYIDQWTLDADLSAKVEELLWTNAMIYAIAGFEANGQFNADFFHMHLVTSSLFLPSVFAQLKRSSQVILLRGYFTACLGYYIGRGRPELDIKRFFTNSATPHPTAPGPKPIPHKAAHPSAGSPIAITPNAWLPILQSTLTHPDDHLPKLQRALSEYGSKFGHVRAGHFHGTELKDAELVDGSLFIRAAGLTAKRMGWVREGEPPLEGAWDRRGFPVGPKL